MRAHYAKHYFWQTLRVIHHSRRNSVEINRNSFTTRTGLNKINFEVFSIKWLSTVVCVLITIENIFVFLFLQVTNADRDIINLNKVFKKDSYLLLNKDFLIY